MLYNVINERTKYEHIDAKICFLIHLYYQDTVEAYMKYINNIPSSMDIYFTYSDVITKEKIESLIFGRENVYFLEKENRGRDMSALLVAGKAIIDKYEYVCFLHDKKPKKGIFKDEKSQLYYEKNTCDWIKDLWDNLLHSENYIWGILERFKTNEKLGILLSPSRVLVENTRPFSTLWGKNFDNLTKFLTEKIPGARVDKKSKIVTIGNVIWFRKKGLLRLFNLDWKYTDFPDEPLPNDGSISHSIERSYGFIAKSEGYETEYVMTEEFASEYMDYILSASHNNYKSSETYRNRLSTEIKQHLDFCQHLGIFHGKDVKTVTEKLNDFFNKNKQIYFYGAGFFGKQALILTLDTKKVPKGFIVTKKQAGEDIAFGFPLISLSEFEEYSKEGVGIVIAVEKEKEMEVKDSLRRIAFSNYLCLMDLYE